MLKRKVHDYSTTPYTVSEVTEHVGRSLFVCSETVRVMSDVWENHMVLHSVTDDGNISTCSVSGWYGQKEGEGNTFEIDATEEAYKLYRDRCYKLAYERRLADATAAVQNPAVEGRVVKVVSGRTAKGTVGKVIVVMDGTYGMGYHGSVRMKKLGIATSPVMVEKVMPSGKVFMNHRDMVWVWSKNATVETPAAVDLVEVEACANAEADRMVAELRSAATHAQKQYPSYNVKKVAA
jgi:hypothetical protein